LRFGTSKRYLLPLGEGARQDHGEFVESRGTSPCQRSSSEIAYNGFVEGELSPVQVEVDHCRRTSTRLYWSYLGIAWIGSYRPEKAAGPKRLPSEGGVLVLDHDDLIARLKTHAFAWANSLLA
jgi:hypothetical protein